MGTIAPPCSILAYSCSLFITILPYSILPSFHLFSNLHLFFLGSVCIEFVEQLGLKVSNINQIVQWKKYIQENY